MFINGSNLDFKAFPQGFPMFCGYFVTIDGKRLGQSLQNIALIQFEFWVGRGRNFEPERPEIRVTVCQGTEEPLWVQNQLTQQPPGYGEMRWFT
jgi:hypothetical protein